MESDSEAKGGGNVYDTKHRAYDPRLGRWFSVDALSYVGAGLSSYQFSFNSPVAYNDPSGLWPWESKNIRAARRYARETGGEFEKYKRNGRTWASVSNGNEDGITTRVFKPSAVTNAEFSATVAGVLTSKETIRGIDNLLKGTGVRLLNVSPSGLRFLAAGATIASMPFTLSGDNPSEAERLASSDRMIKDWLEEGDITAVQEWVKDWNNQPKNQFNRIVFRYMSEGNLMVGFLLMGDFLWRLRSIEPVILLSNG